MRWRGGAEAKVARGRCRGRWEMETSAADLQENQHNDWLTTRGASSHGLELTNWKLEKRKPHK